MTQVSLYLKLHNISVTLKMVRKVVVNLDLSKASGPDCIPVKVLKNCEPELRYRLAELFNKCFKEFCSPDCWKVSSVVPVFKNVVERSIAKNYHLVSLLSVVSKIFEKLVNNRIVHHLEKCGRQLLTGFGMLVFLTNSSLMEFQVRHLALFLLFSVIDDSGNNLNWLLNLNLIYKTLWTG